jgi:hypothetical protein
MNLAFYLVFLEVEIIIHLWSHQYLQINMIVIFLQIISEMFEYLKNTKYIRIFVTDIPIYENHVLDISKS